MDKLTHTTIEQLVDLGTADVNSPQFVSLLESLSSDLFFRSRNPDLSFSFLMDLPWIEACALVRGLVVAENSGITNYRGSVSLVKDAYRALEQRDPINALEVASWVVDHSDNDYIPFPMRKIRYAFECARKEATSWVECKERMTDWQHREFQRQEAASTAIEERQNAAEERRRIETIVSQRLHRQFQIIQKAKAEARELLVSELSGISERERLEHLAWDDEHTLEYFPDQFATFAKAILDSLDAQTKQRLIEKIDGRKSGVWAKVARQLKADG
jgi:hypothetical protein